MKLPVRIITLVTLLIVAGPVLAATGPTNLDGQEEIDLGKLARAYQDAYHETGHDKGGFGPFTNLQRFGASSGSANYEFVDTMRQRRREKKGFWESLGVAWSAWESEFSEDLFSRSNPNRDYWGSCVDQQNYTYEILSQVDQDTWKVLQVGTTAHNWVEIENKRTGERYTFDAWYWQKPKVVKGSQLGSRYKAAYGKNLVGDLTEERAAEETNGIFEDLGDEESKESLFDSHFR